MEIVKFSEKAERIFGKQNQLEKIAVGYFFTEGPVWDEREESLYFTNFNDNTIHIWKEGEGTFLYRKNSGRAVGLSMTVDGRIVSAETKTHSVTFADSKKSEIIVNQYEGKRLNSPNDVVISGDGSLFFTDPYSVAMGDTRELEYNGIFCVPMTSGVLSGKNIILMDDRMERPNGIAFSPDESLLYVNDTNKQLIVAYQMHSDHTGSLVGEFASLNQTYGSGCADGMKVDIEGNLYLTGPGGIWVIDSTGSPIAILKLPENAGNLCFGGKNHMTLFITATSSVYQLPVAIPGISPKRNK